MNELNVVTSNEGKYKEYKRKLSEIYSTKMCHIDYPEIQSDILEDVVAYGLDCLHEYRPLVIDDSGLFVDPLNNFPGVYSAYVMKTIGNEGILRLLENKEERAAYFKCVIGYMDEKGDKRLFEGICKGNISYRSKGRGGFGYDPIFIPENHEMTFAEMSIDQKNVVSHRGIAMDNFLKYLKESK